MCFVSEQQRNRAYQKYKEKILDLLSIDPVKSERVLAELGYIKR